VPRMSEFRLSYVSDWCDPLGTLSSSTGLPRSASHDSLRYDVHCKPTMDRGSTALPREMTISSPPSTVIPKQALHEWGKTEKRNLPFQSRNKRNICKKSPESRSPQRPTTSDHAVYINQPRALSLAGSTLAAIATAQQATATILIPTASCCLLP